MGGCHSSPFTDDTGPPQHRSVGSSNPLHVSAASRPYHSQQQSIPTKLNSTSQSPPPYGSINSSTAQEAATSSVSGPTLNDTAYAFLSIFDTVFLVDDSTSMRGKRWCEAEDAIAAIAPICTQYDTDGIDIYFLNHRSHSFSGCGSVGGYKNVTDTLGVREIFRAVKPSGATPVGARLHQILTRYMRDLSQLTLEGRESELKPLNIIVITDGVFTDDAESVIVKVARELDHPELHAAPWPVGIQLFQVGDDEPARRYLQNLDDELVKRRSREGIRDIVDTVPWRGEKAKVLDAGGILKCVLDAGLCWCQ